MKSYVITGDPIPKWTEAKRQLERQMLTAALTHTHGNMAHAAELFGVTKVAILHAVRRHGLEHLKSKSPSRGRYGSRPTPVDVEDPVVGVPV